MKIKQEYKIILSSISAGLLLWAVDAVSDSSLTAPGSFWKSFVHEMSVPKLYSRFFLLSGFILFGIVSSRIISKRRQIEERYKNLLELSPDIIYLADKEGNQLFMNGAAYRILERSPGEGIGRPMTALIHPDDGKKVGEKLQKMANRGADAFIFENRFITKSGKTLTVLHTVQAIRNKRGEFIGTQGIARDITELKQVREELQEAVARGENEKKRSEAIITASGDGISIQDASFKILYQNQTQRDLIGGNKAGEYCYRVYAHRDTVCPDCPVDATFKDGMIHTAEKTVQWNNKSLTIEIKASPLLDSNGKVVAGIEAVRDITERRKAEEQLILFSEAVEEAVDGIQIADLDGTIVYSNKAVGEIYGFAPRELMGRRVHDMYADKEFSDKVILPEIKKSGRWNGELVVVHKSGRVFPVWLSASLVKDAQGKPIAIVGIIRDITEHKEAEEILRRHHEELMKLVEERTAELTLANEKLRREIADREKMEEELLKAQKLESLGILAGGIAHDFNNLLASILGNISLAMLDLSGDHDAYRQLEGAEKASLRAQDLTRQLLTFSKGGAPVKKMTSIAELVREAAGFALRGARVKCEFSIPPDLWFADVDGGQVSRVIHNLVINADHAMPAGGTITIRCENVTMSETSEDLFFAADQLAASPSLQPGDYVKISVHDHGVGISKKHLSKIFDPYFTTKQKGSGLGLATSYSIIKKHGGHIVAESHPDKGTTFTLFLPASKTARRTKKTNEAPLLTGTGKILLMDDEEEIRQTTGDMIKRLGYTVELAADGARAIDLYQKAREAAPFDAVIMDLTVPGGMGGQEALSKLREIDPDIKAIVSSGYSNDPIMAYYKKYGFSGAVAKPYRIKDLGETLHTVLRSIIPGPSQDQ